MTFESNKEALQIIGCIDSVEDALHTRPGSGSTLRRESVGSVRGWLVFPEDPSACTGAFFSIDGNRFVELVYGYVRQDVAASLSDSRYVGSGFSGLFSPAGLAPGEHRIEVSLRDNRGRFVTLDSSFTFVLEDSDLSASDPGVQDPGQIERAWSTTVGTTLGNIDEITVLGQDAPPEDALVLRARRGSMLAVRGWAIDERESKLAVAVKLVIDSKDCYPTVYGMERADVADALERPDFDKSGFVAILKTSNLSVGTHRISMRVAGESGAVYDVDSAYSIEVEEFTT